MSDTTFKIILASGSPRRRELCGLIGFPFTVQVSEADENIEERDPALYVEKLSSRKAEAVFDLHDEGDILVIGSDTVVTADGKILGKPSDEEDAVRMLRFLSGRGHEVFTGVTLLERRNGIRREVHFHERTVVHMAELTEKEICDYVQTGEPMDKAGAYAIQGKSSVFITGIEGDYYNVVGLPVHGLWARMKELGWL